jgi:hypothetical protein
MCDLGVTIAGTWLEECVEELYGELEARGLRLKPHCWLSDEWFSPAGVAGIAIPFYLAHPRLRRLERQQMLEVEGGSRVECMRILRHEAAHAYHHAYQLHRRRRWQQLFGKSSREYPEFYRADPGSKRYVQHLRLWYAQAHPDEDFAETFAVWLRPRSSWRKRYAGWPALKKLEYVDELMAELAGQRPPPAGRRRVESLASLRKTLGEHYAEKRSHYGVSYPDTYDRDLRRLFGEPADPRQGEAASAFLRRHRAGIRQMVSRWTGEYQFTLDTVLSDMIGRCRELRLRAVGSERRLKLDFTVLLTVKTMHVLYSSARREWIPL